MQKPVKQTAYEPQQQRSQQTLERILAATEKLLETQPFEAITVEQIVTTGASSVGAFYKRFSSKQAMLPALLERTQRMQLEALDDYLHESHWHGQNLRQRITTFVSQILESYKQYRWLAQAIVARQFSLDNSLSDTNQDYASKTVDMISNWLLNCRAEIHHPKPEIAVPVGIASLVIGLQATALFELRPIGFELNEHAHELTEAFLAYVGTTPGE